MLRVYNYVINEDGQPMYLGSRTSVLYYNKTIPSWVWWDLRHKTSAAQNFAFPRYFQYFVIIVIFPFSRYDRKDPSSVAVSISPEASLMLGWSLVRNSNLSTLVVTLKLSESYIVSAWCTWSVIMCGHQLRQMYICSCFLAEPAWLRDSQPRMATPLRLENFGRIDFSLFPRKETEWSLVVSMNSL